MKTDHVLSTLRTHDTESCRIGRGRIAVFGSTIRGDAGPAGDIDLLVERNPRADIGFLEYAGLKRFLGELFPVPIDVANRKEPKPYLRSTVEREAIYAF